MIAITNGKVVTITQGTFDNGTVLVEDGKIKAVGERIEIPEDAQVIDAKGGYITPGLIDCHTHICNFSEPRTMPGQRDDGNEGSDPITPQVRALDAVNPEDWAVQPVREAGFTTVYTQPGSGNIIGGTGIAIKMWGHTADDDSRNRGNEICAGRESQAVPWTGAASDALDQNGNGSSSSGNSV